MAELGDRIGWVTIGEALDLWTAAPGEAEDGYEPLPLLLAAAHEELLEYAPAAVFPADAIPARAKLGQVMLTQHLWARKQAGDADSYGAGDMAMSTYPLKLEARDMLRRWRGGIRGIR